MKKSSFPHINRKFNYGINKVAFVNTKYKKMLEEFKQLNKVRFIPHYTN